MPDEKVWWELHKDTAGCFEQNLEAAPYKTTAVQALTPPPHTHKPSK